MFDPLTLRDRLLLERHHRRTYPEFYQPYILGMLGYRNLLNIAAWRERMLRQ
jgi:hypothetical protein